MLAAMAWLCALALALFAMERGMAADPLLARAASGRSGRRHCEGSCLRAASSSLMSQTMKHKIADRAACEADGECPTVRAAASLTPCADGLAGEYPCNDVDMMAFVPLASMGSSGANDIWGWTDPATGKDYALVGLFDGTAFVDITSPTDPRTIGIMKTQSEPSIWRDLKVYADHVFVVSEAAEHGMQVFDLARLRGKTGSGVRGVEGPGAVKNRYDMCLVEVAGGPNGTASNASDAGNAGNASGSVQLGPCQGHSAAEWAYSRSTGALVSQSTGLCLEVAGPLTLGGLIRMRSCDPGRSGQSWAYLEGTGQLRGRGGCLEAADPREAGASLRVRACDSSARAQQWGLGGGDMESFAPDAVYSEVTSAHNVAINEQTGRAYILGSLTCQGGLHVVDISTPKDPEFLGCYASDGYTHDAQCEIYEGPDARYRGKEICFSYDEDTLTIVDVTDMGEPDQIARVGYNNSRYVHQGWLDEQQEFLFLNDELDELSWDPEKPDGPSNHTRTLIWDMRNLSNPKLVDNYYFRDTVIDHNLYVDGRLVFEANYCAGLRVLEVKYGSGKNPHLEERGFFDVEPACSTPRFRGAWSSYPWYRSGVVAVTSMQRGLFVLQPRLAADLQASRLEAHGRRGERRERGLLRLDKRAR